MKINNSVRVALAGAAIAGVTIALPGVAFAATPATFAQAQQKLEQQLADRVAQLGRLSADITSSKTLTTGHANLLSARIATETASINALVAKVPNDTTAYTPSRLPRSLKQSRRTQSPRKYPYSAPTRRACKPQSAHCQDSLAIRMR